jgi:serralysin
MGILTNRSNYQDIDGILWGWQWAANQNNGHTQLYYSFPTSAAAYGYTVSGFEPFNAAQKAAAIRAIANYDAVCNLDFVFTVTGAIGNIRFAETDSFTIPSFKQDVDTAHGLPPDHSYVIPAAQGDTWFNHTDYNRSGMGGSAYAYGILHEMGHALGLKHGQVTQDVHDAYGNLLYTNPALPAAHDGFEYTVMTYRPYPGAPLTIGVADEAPSTLMQNDILALQWMYGANYQYNSGNTTYRWNSVTGEMSVNGAGKGVPFHNKVLMTIWDGGGIDTYDFSNFATAATIDLRPGGWSTPSRAMLIDLDPRGSVTHFAHGCIANALAFKDEYRGYIENAWGGSGNDVLTGNELRNQLRGNGGNDTLKGGSGNDTLIGGAGRDMLIGGTANDTYYTTTGDVVSEAANAGNDTVWSSATLALGGNLENLVLSGTAAISGAGNGLANLLVGNAAANVLNGAAGNDNLVAGAGNDWLIGGLGNDVLKGGGGHDNFAFNTAPSASANRDTIADFANAAGNNDTIYLENAVFTRLGAGAAHALNPAFFRAGAAAADANDFIVYNKATGALFYDANGSGAGGAIQFATLITKTALTAGDFVVM